MDLGSNGDRITISRKDIPSGEHHSHDNRESGGDENKSKRLVRFFDFLINLSLTAIIIGIPLFFSGLAYQGIAFEKQIYFYFWTLLGLISWASKCGYLGEMKIRRTPLDIPILAFWGSYLVSTVLSLDKWHSFFGFFGDPSRGFLNISAIIIIYYLILSNPTEKLFRWLTRGLLISGTIVTLWMFLVVLGIQFLPEKLAAYFPVSLVGSIEGSVIFLSALIPVFIARILSLQKEEKKNRKSDLYSYLFSLIILIDLFVLFSLYVYTFWLAILIGMVVFLVFILSKIVRPREIWAVLPMAVFVLILIFLMIGPVAISKVNLPYSVNVPYGTSFTIAKDSLKDNFFFGNGSGVYGYAFSKYLPQGFDNMGIRFYQGEGVVLENLANIGAVGTVLFGILVLTYLGVSLFLLTRDKENNKIISLGFIAASIILLVGTVSLKTDGPVLIIWAVVSSLSLAILYKESNVRKDFFNFSLKASPKFALTLAFIYLLIFAGVAFMFVFIGKVYVSDLRMGGAAKETQVSEEGSITKIMKAININPREGRYFSRLGQEYMVLTNQEVLKSEKDRNTDKIQYYLTLAIQASKRAEELMGSDVATVESLAQVYENAGLYVADAYKLSLDEYQKANGLEPSNPDFLLKIGQVKTKLVALEKDESAKKSLLEEAKDSFQKAVDMRANYSPSYFNLALAQEGLGDLDGAVQNMTNAFMLQRDNLNYAFTLARLYQARNKNDDAKIAEDLYKQILGINDKEVNTHFNLGMLYEKTDKRNEAISEYQKVIDNLPDGSDQAREQLNKMIANIRNGVPNTPENLGLTQSQNQQSSPEQSQAQNAPQESSPTADNQNNNAGE